MNRMETAKLLAAFSSVYKDFYKDKDPNEVLGAWTALLQDIPFEIGEAASLLYMRKEHFPPVPADIVEYAASLTTDREALTEQTAWAMVSKACQNGYYGAEKEFSKLPPLVQKTLGSPNQLREWALLDSDTFQTVVASNFMRSFRTMKKREEDYQALPEDIRKLLDNPVHGLVRIGGGTE